MSNAPGPSAPAGWYPEGTNGQRYWDGQQWTDNHVPLAAAPGAPAASVASAKRLFFIGLAGWIGGIVLAAICNGIVAASGAALWLLIVFFFVVSFAGFVVAVVGLVLWLTRRSSVSRPA